MEQKQISQAAIAVWATTKVQFFESQMLNAIDQVLESNERIANLERELEIEKERFKNLEEKMKNLEGQKNGGTT